MIEPAGRLVDPGPIVEPEAEMISFFLHKRGRESVLCIAAMDALENADQSNNLSEPALLLGSSELYQLPKTVIPLRRTSEPSAHPDA